MFIRKKRHRSSNIGVLFYDVTTGKMLLRIKLYDIALQTL
jgi:hypothetical protein